MSSCSHLAGTVSNSVRREINEYLKRSDIADAAKIGDEVSAIAIRHITRSFDGLTVSNFERSASIKLPSYVFEYISYTAGEGLTAKVHIPAAFSSIKLKARVMKDVSNVDVKLELFGTSLQSPIMIAPTGFHRLMHSEGEVATAKAAKNQGICYVYNYMYSTLPIEDVAAVGGCLWASIYIVKDRQFVVHAVRQIETLGFKAIVVTCDHPHNRVKNGTIPKFEKYGDQWWLGEVMRFANLEKYQQIRGEGEKEIDGEVDNSLTWKDVTWLCSLTNLPVICKGILEPEDAILAVDAGASGIIISNHGGRQFDGTPASIEVLPSIVAALKHKNCTILLDSGIRSGTHVLKALALGATGVLVGRPILWGLAVNGEQGVNEIMRTLKDELIMDMQTVGCRTLEECHEKDIIYK